MFLILNSDMLLLCFFALVCFFSDVNVVVAFSPPLCCLTRLGFAVVTTIMFPAAAASASLSFVNASPLQFSNVTTDLTFGRIVSPRWFSLLLTDV